MPVLQISGPFSPGTTWFIHHVIRWQGMGVCWLHCRYTLLMRANKPETAVQSSGPCSPGTTWFIHNAMLGRIALITFSCARRTIGVFLGVVGI